MRVIVLGSGVVGVASAWYLAEAGHEVTVIDRQEAPAMETSFANGGQISVSHAEPWANPSAPLRILRWLGREDSPLLWRLRADPAQWAWGIRFLAQCTAGRARANTIAILALALDSRARLKFLRTDLGLAYQHREQGILHIYSDAAEFDHAANQAALMRQFGCERIVRTAAECVAVEPALAGARLPLAGGTYTPADESGDAHLFTRELAMHCRGKGVRFRFSRPVSRLVAEGGRCVGVRLDGETLRADAVVVCAGSYTPLIVRPLGVSVPVYPAKGYSVTIPVPDDGIAPRVSLTDDGCKIVFSRLGDRLRVAGTAEFAGYDTTINRTRCAAILDRVFDWFPRAGRRDAAEPWAGLRPSTPGNVPLVGPTRIPGLYLNTGHGTLGWTMACGSGKLLADLVTGRAPAVDPTPYRPA
ncbi:MAG TPA: D-amino acid dehydrogenase [Rhodocyclaceae bacterium]|nr:D-amino acid dehydrogenase [Rhodocyclaceae bacterium]HNH36740.1 D-amino acid dehydrogenase [Rhodocyclaceae bacterium]